MATKKESKLPPGMVKRGNTYHARFRHNGNLTRKRLSRNFAAAKELLNDLRVKADKGELGTRDNACAWDELKEAYLRYTRQHFRRPNEQARHLRRFEACSRVTTIRQITHDYVAGFRERRKGQDIEVKAAKKLKSSVGKKVSPRTINREVGTLSAMLTWAASEDGGKRIGYNPIANIKPLPHDHLRKDRRELTVDEVNAVFSHCPPHLLPVFKLLANTGMRRNEVVSLRFSDIDFNGCRLTVPKGAAKSHKPRDIPLDEETMATLRELRDNAGGRKHVFCTLAGTPLKNNLLRQFYAICKRAGIKGAEPGGDVDIHALRVTFTSASLANGASPIAVQELLGHSTVTMTMNTYGRVSDESKRAAIACLPYRSGGASPVAAEAPAVEEVKPEVEKTSKKPAKVGTKKTTTNSKLSQPMLW